MTDFRTLPLIVALSVLASTTAWAQPRGASIEDARHHMELGQDAYAKKEFKEAATQFENAFAASPFAAFLYNAGLAWEKAGEAERSIDLYARYLKAAPNASDYAKIETKVRTLKASGAAQPESTIHISTVDMKSLISVRTNPPEATVRVMNQQGEIVSQSSQETGRTVEGGVYTVEASHPDFRTVKTEIKVSPGQVYIVVVEMSQGAFLGFLHVVSDIPGAEVFIDNKAEGTVGKTPFGNAMTTGKHTLWVEKPGYKVAEQEFEMQLGKETRIDVKLERLSFGTLFVKTNVPKATVHVDGKPLGEAPYKGELSPGQHRLKIISEDMKDYETDFEIKGGQQTKILVRMNPKPSRTSAWVSVGAAAALFIGAGIAGGQALKLDRQLEADQNAGRLANNDPRILHGFLWALGADIGFGVGAIVGGLSIYYFLRDPLPPSEGKLFAPTDFEKNPETTGENEDGSDRNQTETLSINDEGARPKLRFEPILSPTLAGIGFSLAF